MTRHQFFVFSSVLVVAGGLALLAIATHAALSGVWPAAALIAPLGLSLLGAVAWACRQRIVRPLPTG